MNCLDSSEKHEVMLKQESDEAIKYCVFKSNNLCMISGFAGDGQSFETVIRKDEGLDVKYDEECISYEEQF